MHYFSSVYESDDDNELIYIYIRAYRCLMRLFTDVIDAFAFLDKLDNMYTLTPDDMTGILFNQFERLAALLVLPLYILFNES